METNNANQSRLRVFRVLIQEADGDVPRYYRLPHSFWIEGVEYTLFETLDHGGFSSVRIQLGNLQKEVEVVACHFAASFSAPLRAMLILDALLCMLCFNIYHMSPIWLGFDLIRRHKDDTFQVANNL